ncbi:sialidase [bacterium]|nr:sialidase [bacterium]
MPILRLCRRLLITNRLAKCDRIVLAALLSIVACVEIHAADPITAVASRFRHPLLVGNESDPVLRFQVENSSAEPVRFKSIRLDSAGTSLLKSFGEFYIYAGTSPDISKSSKFGAIEPRDAKVRIPADFPIPRGQSYIWITGRVRADVDLTSQVSFTEAEIETDLGVVRPRFESGPATYRFGIALRKPGDDGVHTYRIPALTVSKSGTLLCVYDMRRRMGRDLQEDIDIGLSRSVDGGRTWEPVQVIMDMGEYGGLPQELNGCSDPGIIVDHETGEIFCFAVWMHGKPGKHQWVDDGSEPGFEIGKSAQMLMVRSTDDGKSWSKPENLTRALKKPEWWLLAPAPQSGFQMPDGTLVMPVQGRTGRADKETFATIMTSSDHGRTWTVGNAGYSGGNECQAVRLNDGRIMLNIRNDHERYRAVVVTGDLGKTWTPHEMSRNTLIEPNCNGSIIRIDWTEAGRPRNALVFSNPHSQKARTHQTIQVSLNDGKSWPERLHILLDEGRGAGYPSLTQIDGKHVGIVYEGSRAHVVFQKFRIAELVGTADPDSNSR